MIDNPQKIVSHVSICVFAVSDAFVQPSVFVFWKWDSKECDAADILALLAQPEIRFWQTITLGHGTNPHPCRPTLI